MPSYSVKFASYRGSAVMEVLCDRKDWGETHPLDEHFRFGSIRARMIVTAQAVIRDFLESYGQKPLPGQPVIATDSVRDPSFSVACTSYDHFMRGDRCIQQPYLQLQFSRYSIGLGLSKAEAVIVLMDKIEAFAREDYGSRRAIR